MDDRSSLFAAFLESKAKISKDRSAENPEIKLGSQSSMCAELRFETKMA